MGHSTAVLTWNFPLLHPELVNCELKATLHPPPIVLDLSTVYLCSSSAYPEPSVDFPRHEPHPPPTAEEMHLQFHFFDSTWLSSCTGLKGCLP